MTSPLNGGAPKMEIPATTINFIVQPGPDGQPWAVLEITQGLAKGIFMVPESCIEEWHMQMPAALAELLVLLRRARTGLVVVQTDDLKKIKKLEDGNGR